MGLPWPPQLLAHLAGVVLAAGALSTLPLPPNISYAFDESKCLLSVRWGEATSRVDSCKIEYCTALNDGKEWSDKNWTPNLFNRRAVQLGEKMLFGLRTSCDINGSNVQEGDWFKISLAPNGTAETGATNISCICHNLRHMSCSWKRGRRAPPGTSYRLSFWHENLERMRPCTNHSSDGDAFRCILPFNCSGARNIVLSVRSDSEDIQPVCMFTKEGTKMSDYPIKLDPPSNLTVEQGSNAFFLTWHPPISWSGICYQVERNGIKENTYEDNNNITIPLEPKKYHTLRVRAVLGEINSDCKSTRGLWSEWSKPVHWDNRDKFDALTVVLFVMIPLCAATLTIILLIYLKRIQLLIFPIIPDPEKVLKRMFEDQREEYLPVDHPPEFIKPDIISRWKKTRLGNVPGLYQREGRPGSPCADTSTLETRTAGYRIHPFLRIHWPSDEA